MIDESKQLDNTQSASDSSGEVSEEMQVETVVASTEATEVGTQSMDPDVAPLTEELYEIENNGSLEQQTTSTAAESPTVDESVFVELANKEAQIQSLKVQLAETQSQSKRIAADFENFRKRIDREKEEQSDRIKSATIKEMLPVVDNFERARSQIKPQTEGEKNIHKSYQGVYKQLVDCLKRIGVSPMRCEDSDFDPNLHEAVMREETDQYPEGTVMEELMRGYMLGDRVLRHAMVKVAAALEPSAESAASGEESNESIES